MVFTGFGVDGALISTQHFQARLTQELQRREAPTLFWLSGQGSDCPADGMRDSERLFYGGWVEKS